MEYKVESMPFGKTTNLGNFYLDNMENAPLLLMRTNTVDTESLNDVVNKFKNGSGKIKDYFERILTGATGYWKSISNNISDIHEESVVGFDKDLKRVNKEISNVVGKAKYSDVEHLMIPVMLGMDTDLKSAFEKVNGHIGLIEDVVFTRLSELDILLSNLMSDSDFRKSFMPDKKAYVATSKLNKEIEQTIISVVNPKKNNDRLPVKDLIGNIQSLVSLQKLSVTTSAYYDDIKHLEDLDTKSKAISLKVDAIYEYLNDKDTTTFTLTKNVITALAGNLEETAKLVNGVSALISLSNHLVQTHIHLCETLGSRGK